MNGQISKTNTPFAFINKGFGNNINDIGDDLMKKIMLIITCLIIIMVMPGCADTDLSSNTVIKNDGSGKIVFKIEYDGIVASILDGKSIMDEANIKQSKDQQIRKYMQGSNYVEDYSMNFKNLKDFNQKFGSNKDIKVSIKEQKGFLHNKYTYEMKFLNNFTTVNASASSQSSSSDEKNAVNKYASSVPFKNEVTLPGKILATNAIETKGNNFIWNYSLGQLSPNNAMTATYMTNNTNNIIIMYVLISIVGIALIYSLIIFLRKRKTL